ncbi:MAG: helix-turn-helix transcriptional regulator [Magnetococcales bacterium]|nr:helix-turn-helix transcriptional regulator [Magnetococcales bacterium]
MSRKTFSAQAMQEIGKRIKIVRGERTQVEFGELLGVGRGAITNYEAGRRLPNSAVLEKIAKAGDVTTNWILTGEQNERPLDSMVQEQINANKAGRDAVMKLKLAVEMYRRMGVIPSESISPPEQALLALIRDIPKKDAMEIFQTALDKHKKADHVEKRESEGEYFKKCVETLGESTSKNQYKKGVDQELMLAITMDFEEFFPIQGEQE